MAGPVRKIMLGQVVGTKMLRTAKVRVKHLQLDPYVTQYFPKRATVFAHDPEEEAKVGDIVLVRELPVKRSLHVKYQMERVVYSLGNVTDPVTGKKCDCYSYWDDEDYSTRASSGKSSGDGVHLEAEEATRRTFSSDSEAAGVGTAV